jgi:hypothetical protein
VTPAQGTRNTRAGVECRSRAPAFCAPPMPPKIASAVARGESTRGGTRSRRGAQLGRCRLFEAPDLKLHGSHQGAMLPADAGHEVSPVPARESTAGEVLPGVRGAAGAPVRELRDTAARRGEVLLYAKHLPERIIPGRWTVDRRGGSVAAPATAYAACLSPQAGRARTPDHGRPSKGAETPAGALRPGSPSARCSSGSRISAWPTSSCSRSGYACLLFGRLTS